MHRHAFDLFSFIAGLIVAGLGVAYLVGAYTDLRVEPQWVLPLALVGLGVAGVAASIVAQRRADRRLESPTS